MKGKEKGKRGTRGKRGTWPAVCGFWGASGRRRCSGWAGGLRGRVVLHGEADCVSRRRDGGVGGDMVVGCWREKGKEREHVGREQGQHKVACMGNKGK